MADEDKRVAYGVLCTWWDDIAKAGVGDDELPCCPHCKSHLFECSDEETLLRGSENRFLLRWAKGRCFQDASHMRRTYYAEMPKVRAG